MSFELTDLQENNSDLLNLLTQHLPDMLWVKDIDGTYLYVNQAICDDLLMAKDTQEPIGKNDIFFALRERELNKDKPHWHTFGELCVNSDLEVITKNKPMRFEEYGNVKGEMLYLEVYKAPFYDKGGKIIGTVGAGRDITKLKNIQKDLENSLENVDVHKRLLEFQANYDVLTSLPNRTLFMDRLEQAISIAKRHETKIGVLFIDIDHFKEINDSLGHETGDKVLMAFATRMKSIIRDSDTLARLGGDEFCIILNDIKSIEDTSHFILKYMKVIKEPFIIGHSTFYIRMSTGVSIYPENGVNSKKLLQNSDAAMYKAKDSGRNNYCFYDEEMTKKSHERVYLEAELRKAFKKDELEVYFQAQMDASSDTLIGMEVLVRWKHPKMGYVYPDSFIPLAETTGMIVELDRIVMDKALHQFKEWNNAGHEIGRVSLNLSIRHLEQSDFLEYVQNAIKNTECGYDKLEFEVTETQIMKNPQKSIAMLQQLHDLGIKISVDDFGTGYSSLAYLKKLPIDKLKIDKSFVDGLPNDDEDVAISKTIINLSKSLNLDVIAEGVETKEQKEFLVKNACNAIQGYLYSRPIPIDEMTQFL